MTHLAPLKPCLNLGRALRVNEVDEILQNLPTAQLSNPWLLLPDQVADDLLDYDGDSVLLGKPAGQDATRGKAGFVVLLGRQAAAAEARRLIDDANKALAPWQEAAKYMQSLAEFAITREK